MPRRVVNASNGCLALGIRGLRWALFAPIAVALHQAVSYLYPPVGAFLGGYSPAWTYKLVALAFVFVATVLGVIAAMSIVPSRQKVIGILVGVAFIALDYFSLNASASVWYRVVYVSCAIIAVVVAYFFMIGFLNLISSERSKKWSEAPMLETEP